MFLNLRRPFAVLFSAFAALSCSSADTPPDGSGPVDSAVARDGSAEPRAVVGAAGGSVSLEGGASVTVPAGALTQDIPLSVEVAAEAAPVESGRLSAVYAFGPAGLTFAEAVEVRLPLDAPAESVTVWWSNPARDGWEPVEAVVIDGMAVAQVTHFSYGFAALSDKAPPDWSTFWKPGCLGGVCSAADACITSAGCDPNADGDLCNGFLYCDTSASPHKCVVNPVTVVTCATDGDTVCSKQHCAPATGKCTFVPENEGGPCSDGVKCTAPDLCAAGVCVPGPKSCACTSNADCAAKEDGDLCNGTLFCNKAKNTCELNPATIVKCPTANDTACSKTACDKETGVCGPTAVNEGLECDDGNACTAPDTCVLTQCLGGENVCECKNDADCLAKDKNLCDGLPYCDKAIGKCAVNPASIVVCPTVADTDCAKSACQPSSGLCQITALADGSACSDEDFCTSSDHCSSGSCEPGPMTCECKQDADCAAKESEDLCSKLYCNKASGVCIVNPITLVSCAQEGDTPCFGFVCEPETGFCNSSVAPDGTPCGDGKSCGAPDACESGICIEGPEVCECTQDSECAPKEDGDLCNGSLYCDPQSGACRVDSATVVVCPANAAETFCAKPACVPATGVCVLTPANEGQLCSDGDRCTELDLCVEGTCVPGTKICD